jgi:hypothetical protein
MRNSISFVGIVLLAACFPTTHPDDPGYVDLSGQVIQASGAPLAASSVAIRCGDGEINTKTPTDANGHYAVSLVAPGSLMESSKDGIVLCAFGAPDSINARVHSSVLVGFGPANAHLSQIVNLTED